MNDYVHAQWRSQKLVRVKNRRRVNEDSVMSVNKKIRWRGLIIYFLFVLGGLGEWT